MFGTPTEKIWPGMGLLKFPNGFSLIDQPFNNLKRHFPHLAEEGLDLMNSLFAYDPKKRTSASAAFEHPYFDTSPLPCSPEMMPTFKTLLKPRKTQ
jgi:serine/threonine protein kinase